jgi:enediyne biosynthesis protein E5
MANMQQTIFRDARYFQLIFQTIFLSYGLFYLHWNADWWLYSTYFSTSILVQAICQTLHNRKKTPALSTIWWQQFLQSLPSVFISSFGLCLLLKTNEVYVAIFAATVSIASKYIVTVGKKHIFNPSAIGIVAAVLLTGKAWVSPGQWGSSTILLLGCICFGTIVVTKVQKLDVSLAFLCSFAGLLFVRQIIYLGWPLDYFVQTICTGSTLLFSFFMITDPKTTPNHVIARIVWSVLIGGIAFYLATFKFINAAPIFVLVAAQPLVPLLNYLFRAKQFNWYNKTVNSIISYPQANPSI